MFVDITYTSEANQKKALEEKKSYKHTLNLSRYLNIHCYTYIDIFNNYSVTL